MANKGLANISGAAGSFGSGKDRGNLRDFPPLPEDVIKRFPEMQDWMDQMNLWLKELVKDLRQ